MNKVILIGRLTKDAEIKQTASGIAVATFSVAVDRKYKNEDGSRTADFINCVAWRQTASIIGQYFHKGSKIGIVGNIQSRTYDDNNGQKHYVTEVIVDEVEFVESRNDAQQKASPATPPATAPAMENPQIFEGSDTDADLPFEV